MNSDIFVSFGISLLLAFAWFRSLVICDIFVCFGFEGVVDRAGVTSRLLIDIFGIIPLTHTHHRDSIIILFAHWLHLLLHFVAFRSIPIHSHRHTCTSKTYFLQMLWACVYSWNFTPSFEFPWELINKWIRKLGSWHCTSISTKTTYLMFFSILFIYEYIYNCSGIDASIFSWNNQWYFQALLVKLMNDKFWFLTAVHIKWYFQIVCNLEPSRTILSHKLFLPHPSVSRHNQRLFTNTV